MMKGIIGYPLIPEKNKKKNNNTAFITSIGFFHEIKLAIFQTEKNMILLSGNSMIEQVLNEIRLRVYLKCKM